MLFDNVHASVNSRQYFYLKHKQKSVLLQVAGFSSSYSTYSMQITTTDIYSEQTYILREYTQFEILINYCG